jgi:hypothetical protein
VTPPPIDSAAIRDSIENFQRAALAYADSVNRADSIARADSLAVVAAAEAAEAARLAAARRSTPRRPAATPTRPAPQPAPPPAVVETTRVVVTTPAPAPTPTPVEPPAPAGPGTVRIGSRIPGAVLYIGDEVRPIGQRGVQTLTFPAGPVTISIRAENCARWDTTFTVGAAQTHTIGYRPTSC